VLWGACRTAAPFFREDLKRARGTIAGTVQGPEGIAPPEGRLVEAVELRSGRRYSTHTNATGAFSFLIPPGRYRIDVVLRRGEAVVRRPESIEVQAGGIVTDAVFVLGGAGVAHSLGPRQF
jgi:hypothetical protein